MKKFKITDISISIILIITAVLFNLVQQNLDWIFVEYIVVCAWQYTSMVIHSVNGWFMGTRSKRAVFGNFIAGLFILIIIGHFFPPLTAFLAEGLLYLTPLITGYYVWICYHELHIKMRRPMSLLK